jgi:hypothetical protein
VELVVGHLIRIQSQLDEFHAEGTMASAAFSVLREVCVQAAVRTVCRLAQNKDRLID